MLTPAPKPCTGCPYKLSCPSGVWAESIDVLFLFHFTKAKARPT